MSKFWWKTQECLGNNLAEKVRNTVGIGNGTITVYTLFQL